MSIDFRGGFRCGNGGGMSALCICWECLFFLPPEPLPPPPVAVGGEKALDLELLCDKFGSLSLSFLRVPKLSEDKERGNRDRKAGVE